MAIQAHIKIIGSDKKTKNRKLKADTYEIEQFVRKLSDKEKYYGWEEFVFSSENSEKRIFVKLPDGFVKFSHFMDLANLIRYLDRTYPGWKRLSVSKVIYKQIEFADMQAGMLVRRYNYNTHPYIYLETRIDEEKKEGFNANIEGESLPFEAKKHRRYKYYIINQSVDKDSYDEIFNTEPVTHEL